MGVRCLGRRPQREPALDALEVSDRSAGLHRCGVHPRVDDVLADDDVGAREYGLGCCFVTRLPVEAVVVGLALQVIANHRRGGVKRMPCVDDRLQDVVLDLDQLEGVASGVPVLGDDERDLLALEAHLVGDQHGLDVVGQRWHPCQPQVLERGAGDDRLDLRVRLGGARVDADEAGVRHWCTEDRQVQHAVQLDVVDVVPLATQEARVLLAQHPAVTDRLLVVVLENPGLVVLNGGHDALPTVTGSAVTASMSTVPASRESEATDPAASVSDPAPAAASWAAAHWIDRTIVA